MLGKTLLPKVPRDFPFRRGLRTALRAAHIFATGTLLGGHIFNQPEPVLIPWLLGSIVSGLLLLATDLYASFAVLCEVRGFVVLAKLGLLAIIPVFWDARIPLLLTALLVGVVSSHMPGKYRHKVLLLGDRITPDERRG